MNFYSSLKRFGYSGDKAPDNWFGAFDMLIDLLMEQDHKEKYVVFIDEIAWMDTSRSGFITAFEHFWNGWAASQHNIMLVVCSSAASWVMNNIIDNRGGLYDRTTCENYREEFIAEWHKRFED